MSGCTCLSSPNNYWNCLFGQNYSLLTQERISSVIFQVRKTCPVSCILQNIVKKILSLPEFFSEKTTHKLPLTLILEKKPCLAHIGNSICLFLFLYEIHKTLLTAFLMWVPPKLPPCPSNPTYFQPPVLLRRPWC